MRSNEAFKAEFYRAAEAIVSINSYPRLIALINNVCPSVNNGTISVDRLATNSVARHRYSAFRISDSFTPTVLISPSQAESTAFLNDLVGTIYMAHQYLKAIDDRRSDGYERRQRVVCTEAISDRVLWLGSAKLNEGELDPRTQNPREKAKIMNVMLGNESFVADVGLADVKRLGLDLSPQKFIQLRQELTKHMYGVFHDHPGYATPDSRAAVFARAIVIHLARH